MSDGQSVSSTSSASLCVIMINGEEVETATVYRS